MKTFLRKLINKVVFNNGARGYTRSVGHVEYRVESLNDLLFARNRITNGLGYNLEWIKDYHENQRPIKLIVDLGCNVGWFNLWLDYHLDYMFKPKIIAVDANPKVLETCRKNFSLNLLSSRLVYNCIIGFPEFTDKMTFKVHPSSEASSYFSKLLPKTGYNSVKFVNVPTIGLKELVESHRHIDKVVIDLLKIDIEGAEILLLQSSMDWINQHVNKLIVEWHKPVTDPSSIKLIVGQDRHFRWNPVDTDLTALCGVLYFTRLDQL